MRVGGTHKVQVRDVDKMFKTVHELVKVACREYLTSNGYDVQLLDRLAEGRVLLPEANSVRRHIVGLTTITESLPESLVQRARALGIEESQKFMATLPSLAHTTEYKKLRRDLDEMDWAQFALTKMAAHLAVSQLGLELITDVKRQLLDGTLKDKMVESWLALIESKVSSQP